MGITIRHLEGPLAGEQHFGDRITTILVGRSVEADVRFPDECLKVDREHLRLNRKIDGSYKVELCGPCDVEIDGVPAEDNAPVSSGSVITVGVDGPRFEVLLPGVTIKHLEGPLAGQTQYFPPAVETIAFGRPPAKANVSYPPSYSRVGRHHFCLKRNTQGDYCVVLTPSHFVEVDGMEADNGMMASSGSVFRLGDDTGPSFIVVIEALVKEETPVWVVKCNRAERESASHVLSDALSAAASGAAALVTAVSNAASQAKEAIADAFHREETAVDLLVSRRAEVPSDTVGLPARSGARTSSRFPTRPLGEAPAKSRPPQGHAPRGTLGHVPPKSFPKIGGESPYPMAEKARRFGVLWWIVVAAMLAGLGYLLYRREIVVGGALSKLFQAAMPPPPNTTKKDLVDVSVFGPTAVKAGGEGLIQVFLHCLDQREIAQALAREADPDATRRGVQTLAAEIARGQRVEIILEGRGLEIDQAMQPLVWRGEPCACQFTVSAPKDSLGRTYHPRVLVLVDSVPVGSVTFALKASRQEKPATELRGDHARRYNYAFLSYASPDLDEVIKRAQGLKAGGTKFFNDLLSLDPGERWEQRLYEEIDNCDVFYLFWSSNAKASEWVMKETAHALARQANSADGEPDIIPVIIEGPPTPAAPESLQHIHFNDALIYVLGNMPEHPPSP